MARHGGGSGRGARERGTGEWGAEGGDGHHREGWTGEDYGWQDDRPERDADAASDWRADDRRRDPGREDRASRDRARGGRAARWGGGRASEGGSSPPERGSTSDFARSAGRGAAREEARPPWEQAGWEEAYDTGTQSAYDTGTQGAYGAPEQGAYHSAGYGDEHHVDGGYPEPGYGPDQGGQMGFAEPGPGYAADETTGRYEDDPAAAGHGGYSGYEGYPDSAEFPAVYAPGGDYPSGDEYSADEEGYTGYQDAYADYPDASSGRPARDHDDDRGYADTGGWYADVDHDQDWAEEEYEDDFLPGLSGGARTRDRGRPGGRPRSDARGGKAKRKTGRRRSGPVLAVVIVLLLALVGGAGGTFYWYYRNILHPLDYSGSGTGSVVIQIKPGETAMTIGQILADKGVVATARAFANAAKASPEGKSLKPGYYILHKHMQASLAFALLLSPKSIDQVKVTIPEGWRVSQAIARLGSMTGKLKEYQAAVKDIAALGLPSWAKGPRKPEGYLFPATYTITPDMSAQQVLQQMVQQFKDEVAKVDLTKVAVHDELTPAQIIVVASIVQAEGGRVSDFPKIARVIYNRWNQGIKLQCDSTIMYALSKYGIRATGAETNIKSPYNTYRYYGLPPGPIDNPGDAAIQAAMHPAHGDWTYFVTVNPQTRLTKFTSDPNQAAIWVQELNAWLAKHQS